MGIQEVVVDRVRDRVARYQGARARIDRVFGVEKRPEFLCWEYVVGRTASSVLAFYDATLPSSAYNTYRQ